MQWSASWDADSAGPPDMDVDITCRSVLFAVFAVAAFSKLRSVTSYRDFAESLRPLKATRLAPVVVGAEVLVVVLLLTEWALLGYLLAAGLLLVFVIEISRSLRHDVPVSCRCFGGRGGQLGRRHVVRNALLALVSLAGASVSGGPGPASAGAAALAAGTGLLVSLLFIGWDELAFVAGLDEGPESAR